jgi:hypothetical protein
MVWGVLYGVPDCYCPRITPPGSAAPPEESLMPPPSAQCRRWSSAAERGVALRTADAHNLYSQLGFLPADKTVMQRPRPVG